MDFDFSPDSRTIVAGGLQATAGSGTWTGTVHLFDGADLAPLHQLGRHDRPVLRVHFSEDGLRVLSVGQVSVRLWSVADRSLQAATIGGGNVTEKSKDVEEIGFSDSVRSDDEGTLLKSNVDRLEVPPVLYLQLTNNHVCSAADSIALRRSLREGS